MLYRGENGMTDTMRYTDEELAVIDGVIGRLYPRMSAGRLREAYYALHQHIQSGAVGVVDLKRIRDALEFIMPDYCAGLRMEEQHEMTTLMLKTQTMLKAAGV